MKELPQEVKEHVKSLVLEFQDITMNIIEIRKKPMQERTMIRNRLKEIKEELLEIKEQYKDD